MADDIPDFTDRDSVEAWVSERPRDEAILVAARAALRALPWVAREHSWAADRLRSHLLPAMFRATATAWMAQGFASQGKADSINVGAAAAKAAEVAAAAANDAEGNARYAANAAGAAARVAANNDQVLSAGDVIEAVAFSTAFTTASHDAAHIAKHRSLRDGLPLSPLWPLSAWPAGPPSPIPEGWATLKANLEFHPDEFWQVWIDWYEARLRGDPPDWERERAYVLDLDDFWTQGPAAANAEIARRLADLAADRPSGERLDVIPETGRIGIVPAEPEDPDALENAVQKVEDALADFRASPSANIAGYALGAALRKLDRALARYRENARRLHDDFADATRIIARAVADDPELDTPPVLDLAETCAQGVIDIRIASKAVSDMEADRRRRRARAPSGESRAALTRLLQETGEALEPDLAEEMAEDVAELEACDTSDDELLPDGAAKDAELRLAHRVASLFRFGRMTEAQIGVYAERAMRNVDEIERLVNLLKTFDDWWPLISLVLRGG